MPCSSYILSLSLSVCRCVCLSDPLCVVCGVCVCVGDDLDVWIEYELRTGQIVQATAGKKILLEPPEVTQGT